MFVKAHELTGQVQDVIYYGAQHLSADELVDLSGVRRGSPMNPNANQLAPRGHREQAEGGRPVLRHRPPRGGGQGERHTRVVFNIVEGPVVRVKAIEFRGNDAVSTGRLKDPGGERVRRSSPGVVTVLSPKLNPADGRRGHQEDRPVLPPARVHQRLGPRGRGPVGQRRGRRQPSSTTSARGAPYTVRNVRIDGNKTFSENRLRQVTALKTGERYDADVVTLDEKRIETLCGKRRLPDRRGDREDRHPRTCRTSSTCTYPP